MHVDGPGATQKFERKAMVVEERWLTKTESRKKSHAGKSGREIIRLTMRWALDYDTRSRRAALNLSVTQTLFLWVSRNFGCPTWADAVSAEIRFCPLTGSSGRNPRPEADEPQPATGRLKANDPTRLSNWPIQLTRVDWVRLGRGYRPIRNTW